MTHEEISSFLDAVPFRSFTLATASGKTYRVDHPDYLLFVPSRRVALVFTNGDRYDALDVPLITEINHTGPRAKAGPGRKGRA